MLSSRHLPLTALAILLAILTPACSSDADPTSPDADTSPDTDTDADTNPTPDADTDATPDADPTPDADTTPDTDTCTPDCSARTCGLDPVCQTSCGTCSGDEVCTEQGLCEAPESTVVWRVDDEVVYTSHSVEVGPVGGAYSAQLYFPDQGRNVQISIASPASLSCADENWNNVGLLSLSTFDNGWSGLDALPEAWRGLNFNNSHCVSEPFSGDDVTRWTLEITTADATRLAGSFAMTVEGTGPRQGSTLTIEGSFDVER
ncbi:hypothetical protein [Lujinxingia vulgaris]|uniref:hypothetical protein n=1 Tax=Lujinxingia vulgaris TaxID=2600176 RepID=UPI001E6152DA|nr:hypothetical protein [Lujinxingia vulgaris]